jgi:small conductance mechanosensitive channel
MKEEMATLQNLFNVVTEFLVNYSFQVVGAIVILVVGFLLARWASNLVVKIGRQREMDVTLIKFFGSVVKVLILVFVVIMALGKFGISIAPFIAAIGAVAFGASFAIQGPLSNYGAGLVIILTRPFVVGNTINVKGVGGVVEEINLAYTVLTTEDEERITIPNNKIIGEILQNSFENKVVETRVGIAYDNDPQKAIDVIRETLKKFPQITPEPGPQIGIEEFADSAINIGMRYWVPTKQYFQTIYAVNISVYQALVSSQITIPFPQRDVHMISHPGSTGVTVLKDAPEK